MLIKTVAQQIQRQRAEMIARLQALDPDRALWKLTDSYAVLRETALYLLDRQTLARV